MNFKQVIVLSMVIISTRAQNLFNMFPTDAQKIIQKVLSQKKNKFFYKNQFGVKNLSIKELWDTADHTDRKIKRKVGWSILAQHLSGCLYLSEQGGYFYFLPQCEKEKNNIWIGSRNDHVYSLKNYHPERLTPDALKQYQKELTGYYKIHLMPQQDEEDQILWILLNEIKQNKRLKYLIAGLKIGADLNKKTDEEGQAFPTIVIYPSSGQETAQELIEILCKLFEKRKGADLRPRYNERINSLIFYAQSDADYKSQEARDLYFDPSTDYALYKPNFTGILHDYHLRACFEH